MVNIQIKRVYDSPDNLDGKRILVDRLWPRGLAKDKAHVDIWVKELAPSPELRKWFNHIPERFDEFRERYWKELQDNLSDSLQLEQLCKWVLEDTITLLYSAKDNVHNNAVVLKDFLMDMWNNNKN